MGRKGIQVLILGAQAHYINFCYGTPLCDDTVTWVFQFNIMGTKNTMHLSPIQVLQLMIINFGELGLMGRASIGECHR